jgi:hypothetical protein
MKIRPVPAKLLYAGRQTHDEANGPFLAILRNWGFPEVHIS